MDFVVDGKQVRMTFGVEDVYNNTANFENHRAYINHHFKAHGLEITKWNWDRNPDTGKWENFKDGVQFKSTDSQLDLRIEVIGTIGVNIKETTDVTDSGYQRSGIIWNGNFAKD